MLYVLLASMDIGAELQFEFSQLRVRLMLHYVALCRIMSHYVALCRTFRTVVIADTNLSPALRVPFDVDTTD
jgi:hypothetical protein